MHKTLVVTLIISLILPIVSQAQNILLNSSFEIWLDSLGIQMPFAWFTSEATDSGSATRTTNAHSGLFAIKLTGSDTSAFATTISIVSPQTYYYFSGWCKTQSFAAGAFIITWLKLSQQPAGTPTIIPIYYSNTYRNYNAVLQAPDSAIFVNVTVGTLPYLTIYVDDVTLSDTALTGIEEQPEIKNKEMIGLNISPTPCQNYTFIRYNTSELSQISLSLYDIRGRLIKELISKIKHPQNGIYLLDTKNLKSGIYFVQLKTKHKTINKKLIIQK
ncbi:MAG: T9SS type A sorting domain-containing protein [candidate division WOR-3 bacterium]|nr:T9SS type A sorting domain-containing protein [candidate division WOR-3 bacterium]